MSKSSLVERYRAIRAARNPADPQSEPPPFLTRVANFATSAAKHVAAGAPRCTDEQVAERFAICQGCEFLNAGVCSKCGCDVKSQRQLISKLSWAGEACPIGKWGAVAPADSTLPKTTPGGTE